MHKWYKVILKAEKYRIAEKAPPQGKTTTKYCN